MGEEDRKRAVDAFSWSLNIFASVAIVMVNKQLMSGDGYNFKYGARADTAPHAAGPSFVLGPVCFPLP